MVAEPIVLVFIGGWVCGSGFAGGLCAAAADNVFSLMKPVTKYLLLSTACLLMAILLTVGVWYLLNDWS